MDLEETDPLNEGVYSFQALGEDDLAFKKRLETLEAKWFEEAKEEQSLLPWYKRPNKTVLYLVVTFYTISFTILLSPLMVLMIKNACVLPGSQEILGSNSGESGMSMSMSNLFKRMDMGGGNPSKELCPNKSVYKTVSNIQTILSMISGLLGFVLSSKFGQLSDRFGRVYVFKIFSIINTLHSFGLIFYFQIYSDYNKFLMIFFLSIGYFSGGIMTLISNANGYVCDIDEIENRTVSISILMAIIYLSLGIGPLLSSFLIKASGNTLVMWISFLCAGISTLLVYTLLKESKNEKSLQMANQRYHDKYDTSKLEIMKSITTCFKPIKRLWLPRLENGSLVPRINVLILVVTDMIQMAACVGMMHILILYCISKFNWTGVEIGYYTSITGFGKCFVLLVIQPLLYKLLIKKYNYKVNTSSVDGIDKILILCSMFFIFISLLLIVLTKTPSIIYLSAVLQSLAGMISPIIQGAIVKYSSQTESGEMFGVIAVTRHLQMFLIPVLLLQVYSATLDKLPRFVFWLPISGSLICLILGLFYLKTDSNSLNLDIEEEFEMSE